MKPPDHILPDGWTADDVTITCPHGHRREHDGQFNDCSCSNPIQGMGLI